MKKLFLILTLAAFALMTNAPQVSAAGGPADTTEQSNVKKAKKGKKKGKKGKKPKKGKKKGKKETETK